MTSSSTNKKIKEFELSEEFQEKYGITRIYTKGKNLLLEHFKNGLIISEYYDDDITKTIKALEKAFITDSKVEIEFVHSDSKQFLKDFGQMLGRRLIQDSQDERNEEQQQEREDQQHKYKTIQEVKALRLLHSEITLNEWLLTLQQKHDTLYNTVQEHMPDIWLGLDFTLSVLRILNLHDCTQPFIGLLLGRPGSGKTVILTLPRDWIHAYFKDRFTPKAFVTHTTAVNSREELEAIDMLPQMRDNIFLTPELSPTFSKKEDELIELIGIIVRLADGKGLSDHSGAHGAREYRDTMFTWAGAAVDIPNKVYKILSTLGPKWYHFRLPFKEKTQDELVKEAVEGKDFSIREGAIKESLFDYLKWFEIAPHSVYSGSESETEDDNTLSNVKIKWDKQRDEYQAHVFIVKVAMLLTHLRCAVVTWQSYTDGDDMNYESSICEDPSRTRQILYNLARGHALSRGRNYITVEDVPIVVKTVLSTAHIDRVAVFSLLISMPEGKLTTDQIMKYLNKSKHYALKTMTEFKAIGLADMDDINVNINVKKQSGPEYTIESTTKQITLKEEFKWFLSEEFYNLKEGFVATDNRAYMNIKEEDQDQKSISSDVSSDTTRAQNRGDILVISFWTIYDQLEAQIDNGNGGVVNHNRLHEALVSSGRFYQGDATQIISDMVDAGRLEVVAFHEYRKK